MAKFEVNSQRRFGFRTNSNLEQHRVEPRFTNPQKVCSRTNPGEGKMPVSVAKDCADPFSPTWSNSFDQNFGSSGTTRISHNTRQRSGFYFGVYLNGFLRLWIVEAGWHSLSALIASQAEKRQEANQ